MKTSHIRSRCPGPLTPHLNASAEWTSDSPPLIHTEASRNRLDRFTLDEWSLLLLCDGTRTPKQLLTDAAAQNLPITAATLTPLLKRARASGLFAPNTSGLTPQPPPQQALASEPLVPDTLPEARYQCERCGESCSAGYDVGPLPPTTRLPAAATVRLPTPGGLAPHLPHLDGRCTQLDPATGLCTLHATLGFDAKPEACRHFPILLLHTPEGPRAALQWECTRLHRQLDHGPALVTQLEGAHPLVPETLFECVEIGDGRLVSFARYRHLEQVLLDACLRYGPDTVAFSLPPLVRAWAGRSPESAWEDILATTASSLKDCADQFLLDQSRLIVALYQDGQALHTATGHLHPSDRRRVYRTFCQQILERWIQGGPIPLTPLPALPLFTAWMRNKLFALSLLTAPSVKAGALELLLRWSMLRTGLTVPLDFSPEGSPGDAENRRLVALEHGLRAERLWTALIKTGRI